MILNRGQLRYLGKEDSVASEKKRHRQQTSHISSTMFPASSTWIRPTSRSIVRRMIFNSAVWIFLLLPVLCNADCSVTSTGAMPDFGQCSGPISRAQLRLNRATSLNNGCPANQVSFYIDGYVDSSFQRVRPTLPVNSPLYNAQSFAAVVLSSS